MKRYVKIPNLFISSPVYTVGEKAMAMYLASRCNNKMQCCVSLKLMSKEMNVAKSTINSFIKGLVSKGVVKKENRFGEDGGRLENRYTVVWEAVRC